MVVEFYTKYFVFLLRTNIPFSSLFCLSFLVTAVFFPNLKADLLQQMTEVLLNPSFSLPRTALWLQGGGDWW